MTNAWMKINIYGHPGLYPYNKLLEVNVLEERVCTHLRFYFKNVL